LSHWKIKVSIVGGTNTPTAHAQVAAVRCNGDNTKPVTMILLTNNKNEVMSQSITDGRQILVADSPTYHKKSTKIRRYRAVIIVTAFG
jgi:hypothetical protein